MASDVGVTDFITNFDDLQDMQRGLFDSLKVKNFINGQDYDSIVKECRKSVTRWTDPEFPPSDRSLFFKNNPAPSGKKIEWKRVSEISKQPKLFNDGVDPNDVNQGDIGNCWFVAGLSLMATKKGLLTRVVPEWNDFENEVGRDFGVYRFRFWRLGQWIEVVVDDHLPTYNNRFLYVSSKDKNEYWSSLIEKAYAKVYGSYESLVSGLTEDALTDFTGGITEKFELGECGKLVHSSEKKAFHGMSSGSLQEEKSLFDLCLASMHTPSLMSAAIDITDESKREAKMNNGLVMGHAYAVTAVAQLQSGQKLVRLRNPWGSKEWTGDWSDGSPLWNKVSEKDRSRFLVQAEDGEFWMSWNDFASFYTTLTITRLVNTSYFSRKKRWYEETVRGEWDPSNRTAGGCLNNKATFLPENHQYSIMAHKDQTLLIGLMQNDKRGDAHLGVDNFSIGFYLYPVELNRKYRLHEIPQVAPTAKTIFINARENVMRVELPRGHYYLIPCSFKQNMPGQFLLRMYSETDVHLKPVMLGKPKQMCPCMAYPQGALQLRIIQLKDFAENKQVSAYAVVTVEGQKGKTFATKELTDPKFMDSVIFSLKKFESEVTIKVYEKKLFMDSLIGATRLNVTKWCNTPGRSGIAILNLTAGKVPTTTAKLSIEAKYSPGFPPRYNAPKKSGFEKEMRKSKGRV